VGRFGVFEFDGAMGLRDSGAEDALERAHLRVTLPQKKHRLQRSRDG
jgi:hypothetical protein